MSKPEKIVSHGLTWRQCERGWELVAPRQHVCLINYTKSLFDGWRISLGGSIVGPKFKTCKTALAGAHRTIKPMLQREIEAMEKEGCELIGAATTLREILRGVSR